MLKKILSGMQTGSDFGGIKAAKILGLETGGWMPKGFMNLTGKHPEYAELYGVKEHESPTYPPRTFLNVKESDATVRFAYDFSTAGERCTLNAIQQYKKPWFDVYVQNPEHPHDLRDWLADNKVEVLNVAGNSHKTWSGMETFVVAYLLGVLKDIKIFDDYWYSSDANWSYLSYNDDNPLWQYHN